jgi:hypothetical protein
MNELGQRRARLLQGKSLAFRGGEWWIGFDDPDKEDIHDPDLETALTKLEEVAGEVTG